MYNNLLFLRSDSSDNSEFDFVEHKQKKSKNQR